MYKSAAGECMWPVDSHRADARRYLKVMNFALHMMSFVLKMMNFVLQMMNCVSKTMKFVSKAMDCAFK